MTENIEARVRTVVIQVAKLPPDQHAFSRDADLFRELGVESTAALDLLLSLEEAFNVSIPDDKFGDARSLAALSALIAELS